MKGHHCNVKFTQFWEQGESIKILKLILLFLKSDELLDILISILNNDEALNPLLASFFSKIFGGLLKHHPEQTWNYLKNKEDLMENIIKHLPVRKN